MIKIKKFTETDLEFKELTRIELVVNKMIIKYYGEDWKKEKKKEVADFFGGEVNEK